LKEKKKLLYFFAFSPVDAEPTAFQPVFLENTASQAVAAFVCDLIFGLGGFAARAEEGMGFNFVKLIWFECGAWSTELLAYFHIFGSIWYLLWHGYHLFFFQTPYLNHSC